MRNKLSILLLIIFLSTNSLAINQEDILDTYHKNVINTIIPEEEYILVLNEEPIINIEQKELKTKALKKVDKIKEEQLTVKSKLAKKDISVKKSTKKILNSLLVEANPEELEELKQKGIITDYVKNEKISVFLDESAPFLNVTKIWNNPESPYTGEGVIIAVIDTGVDYTHPSLGGCLGAGCKVIAGHDFVNGDDDPMDDHSHGTHVASTIAGNDPNGLKGMAPGASIVAIKILDEDGGGNLYDILDAYDYIVDLNNNSIPFEDENDYVDIVSMSLGAAGNHPEHPLALATDKLMKKGVLPVIAAGNSGPNYKTIGIPGSSKEALTVGASGNNYGRQGSLLVDGIGIETNAATHSGVGSITGTIWDGGDGTDLSGIPADSIALVRRGNITFNEMVINAKAQGIEGLIIANYEAEVFTPLQFMSSTVKTVAISSDYIETVLGASSVTINVERNNEWSTIVASFSSVGPVVGINNSYMKPDVVAPGSYICAASITTPSLSNKCFEGDYFAIQGTSMATPHVSGIAALYKEAYPDIDSFTLRDKIKSSTRSINAERKVQGSGLVTPNYLFDENRSIILNGSLSFKPIDGKIHQNFTIYNPTNQEITYYLSSEHEDILTFIGQITIAAGEKELVVVDVSEEISGTDGDITIQDSLGNTYYVLFVADNSIYTRINLEAPMPENLLDNIHSFSVLLFFDSESREQTAAAIKSVSLGDNSYYMRSYNPDIAPEEAVFFYYVYTYDNYTEGEDAYREGHQYLYLSNELLDGREVNIDFENCEDHLFKDFFEEGNFSSFFSYNTVNASIPLFAPFKLAEKAFRTIDLEDFYYLYSSSSNITYCIKNMPNDFNFEISSYKQDYNDFYIIKKRLDNIPEMYSMPDDFETDSFIIAEDDDDGIVYPYSGSRYKPATLYYYNNPDTAQRIDLTKPIRIHSQMDEESFFKRGLEVYLYTEDPDYKIVSPGGLDIISPKWEEEFLTLPSYKYFNGQRFFNSDNCVADGVNSVSTKLVPSRTIFVPDDFRLYSEPFFLSGIFDISPGNINFYTNLMSASRHAPVHAGFADSLVGIYPFKLIQSSEISLLSCTSQFYGLDENNNYGVDVYTPISSEVIYPLAASFSPYPNQVDYHSMNITYSWHSTMDLEDANPPSIIDIDLEGRNLSIAIADEALSGAVFTINSDSVTPELIGNPYSIQPITEYSEDPEDYFKITLPDDEWSLITIYAVDQKGNWFSQSFYARASYDEEVFGDLNGDSFVDVYDLYTIAQYFGSESGDGIYESEYDLNSDEAINILDLLQLINNLE